MINHSMPANSGSGTRGGKGKPAKTKGGAKFHSKTKPKKSTRTRMTREADERIRASTSRRLGTSNTKKSATFMIDAPESLEVAIAGSFSNWEPQPMIKGRDGVWRITVQLMPGTHQYKFLVDTEWHEDPNNPRKVPNEFGGMNSICEVL
ncbi:MAG: hypothetical protein HZB43_11035 [candidate division Zixibacteria bacterium]|nr:hypothetical protein [candidate division Zixibacteria bacterium]